MMDHWLIYAICFLAVLGVITRPKGWPDFVWALAGAFLLVIFGLMPLADLWAAVMRGRDVYAFLIGMMLLSELARQHGLFDWLAAQALKRAKGSSFRLFALIYGVGIVVTVFLSNDATAVVLTPAIAASVRAAGLKNPMPYLLISAFIANAASFVLPISNPANLVIFANGSMPPLQVWVQHFALPSCMAIISTFLCLWWCERKALALEKPQPVQRSSALTPAGKLAGLGLVLTALLLVTASALGLDLGMITLLTALCITLAMLLLGTRNRSDIAATTRLHDLLTLLKHISWGVLPLVAGLFTLVGALDKTGITAEIGSGIAALSQSSQMLAIFIAGFAPGLFSNLVNNLPAGLVAGAAVHAANAPQSISAAVLIGIDLGPNLSITGSLATLLWLAALKREGLSMSAIDFLKRGFVVMLPALFFSLLALSLTA